MGDLYYRPRIISVKDTKTRPWRVSGLYRTSRTIGRGVAESRGLRSGTQYVQGTRNVSTRRT